MLCRAAVVAAAEGAASVAEMHVSVVQQLQEWAAPSKAAHAGAAAVVQRQRQRQHRQQRDAGGRWALRVRSAVATSNNVMHSPSTGSSASRVRASVGRSSLIWPFSI